MKCEDLFWIIKKSLKYEQACTKCSVGHSGTQYHTVTNSFFTANSLIANGFHKESLQLGLIPGNAWKERTLGPKYSIKECLGFK
ncbi:TPA: hypothetical protein GDO54_018554 [Pyxicephalus adspersus]|uniref:Uncharacterized protein n=1 Tax=Pyxicephalus adspersus TaxID=30357 RepID=A0AAV2ZPJ9_PYXAD|nr:TPA: hypothetical protein GDO54_018554 [Pyxicephalus adspersus]